MAFGLNGKAITAGVGGPCGSAPTHGQWKESCPWWEQELQRRLAPGGAAQVGKPHHRRVYLLVLCGEGVGSPKACGVQ